MGGMFSSKEADVKPIERPQADLQSGSEMVKVKAELAQVKAQRSKDATKITNQGLQSESVMMKLKRLEAELAQVKEQRGKDAKEIANLTKKVEDGRVQQAKNAASIKELQKQGKSMKKSLDSIEERQQNQPTKEDLKEMNRKLLQDARKEFHSDSASQRSLY